MTTVAGKLIYLNNTKLAIKAAIEQRGVAVTSQKFRDYAEYINQIKSGGGAQFVAQNVHYTLQPGSIANLIHFNSSITIG